MKQSNKKVNILDTYFNSIYSSNLMNELEGRIKSSLKTFIVTANPEIVMYGQKDSTYLDVVNQADYVIADGYGVILGSKILRNSLPERIAGFDLMTELLKKGELEGWSAYFLGAKENVINQAVTNIKAKYPKLNVVGWHHGYTDVNDKVFVEELAAKKPDLIFVGIGFPNQEYWIEKNMSSFEKGLFMGVGGSFDVWSGNVNRAPKVWQNLHAEWLYRLIQEPSRWRRMIVLPQFVIEVMKKRLRIK